MTQNNINEWEEMGNVSDIISHAVESSFIAYKESDIEGMQEIMTNAIKRIRKIKEFDFSNSNFSGIELTENDKRLMMLAHLRFDIIKMTSTLERIIEDYEQKRMFGIFGING